MWAGVIGAHDAPKRLWVSNMRQKIAPDSLVAAAYTLIISRQAERWRGSGRLRQHERYQSRAFQWHRDAGPFRPVTVSYSNSAFPVCFPLHAHFCHFLFSWTDFPQQFVSLTQTLSLAFIWKLMLSWSEAFRIQRQEACFGLPHNTFSLPDILGSGFVIFTPVARVSNHLLKWSSDYGCTELFFQLVHCKMYIWHK